MTGVRKKETNEQSAYESGASDIPEPEQETIVLEKPRSAYQRLIVAMKVIEGMPFAKDQSNTVYKSVPIDTMRNAVRKACIEAGLVHILADIEYEVSSRGATTYYVGKAVMRFVNVDDPEDFVDFPTIGAAMDNGDKHSAKFESNLIKNAYKAIFDIGERGKDDIDSYSNEEIEAEADRIEEIRQRRERRQEAVKKDPFFSKPEDPLIPLRKQIGPLMLDHASVVLDYKKRYGNVPDWSEETLKACIAECRGGEQ